MTINIDRFGTISDYDLIANVSRLSCSRIGQKGVYKWLLTDISSSLLPYKLTINIDHFDVVSDYDLMADGTTPSGSRTGGKGVYKRQVE